MYVNGYRGVGSLEGLSYESANQQLQEGDLLSPNWRPRLGTDGTPNESSQDVLVRVRQVGLCMTIHYQYWQTIAGMLLPCQLLPRKSIIKSAIL